jgi:hypothetical protein
MDFQKIFSPPPPNTAPGEFLGVAWADDNATIYVCANCRYVLWFAP